MSLHPSRSCIAFDGPHRIAQGPLEEVARITKLHQDAGTSGPLLVFDDADSHPIELDLRGSVDDVLARLIPATAAIEPVSRGPGRPKLGVVPREVTLLPRHWDWLGQQPGGASAVLRKLVEQAIRRGGAKQRARGAVESVDRFMRVMAGDEAGYEEASRAFYRGERALFDTLIAAWPTDVREHLQQLAAIAWDEQEDATAPA
ncbi:DUF2239 family protein [Rhodanobacter sp. AS-Z3]|uniref:DUF2239 family protein n=1 Tax=Rhodanobacter sp. AS-Z3 TaxID=3031330 RepID=UPI002478A81C|nr:DUF2239 family protein [Rhodanobacter sp. AS-Z3]WEN15648.1 DUF2239 family protein [Rhodanobacter sp. AS-Z3]